MPKIAFLSLICALTLLSLAVACSGGESDEPEPPPEAASITIESDDGISDEDSEIIREAIEASRRFYAAEMGRDLQLDMTVKITTIDGGNLGGFSRGRTAWILAGGEDWPSGNTRFATIYKSRLAAHELFHNFQWDLMYTDDAIPSSSPWWILEGSAEYASELLLHWSTSFPGISSKRVTSSRLRQTYHV